MKHLLAAATFAALLSAVPASAQVAYGMSPGDTAASGGNWRNNVVVYAEAPDSILLDKMVAPIGDAGAAPSVSDSGAAFAVQGGPNLAALGGVATNAVNPVPEPATWAMMLVGFGAVGGVLRTRKAALRYA